MMFRLFLAALVLLMPLSARADKPTPATPVDRLNKATKQMLEGLDKNQMMQFAAIRDAHGIIRAVENVEKTLYEGTKSCAAHNPDMIKTSTSRFELWKSEIDPLIAQAKDRVNQMAKYQSFAKQADVKNYLKLLDAAVLYKTGNVKTIPVKSKEECIAMLKKMDATRNDLKSSLIENLGLDKELVQKAD